MLRVFGLRWWLWPVYLRNYVEHEALNLAYIDHVAVDRPRLDLVRSRARASLRLLTAYEAWYPVLSEIVKRSFQFGLAAALITIVVRTMSGLADRGPFLSIASAIVAVVTLTAFVRIGSVVSRDWRSGMAWYASWIGGATIVLLHLKSFAPPYVVVLETTCDAVIVFAAIVMSTLLFSQGAYQLVTWGKSHLNPEAEIIGSAAVASVEIAARAAKWADPKVRDVTVRDIEWIARRFEADFFARYGDVDRATLSWCAKTGNDIARSLRALKRGVLFPDGPGLQPIAQRFTDVFICGCEGRWAQIRRDPPEPDELAADRPRIPTSLQRAAAIAVPIAIVGALQAIPFIRSDEDLNKSIVTAGVTLAVVGVLALISPGDFDKQVSAMKGLADVLGTKRP
jgi:hypothetical protein